MLYTTFDTTGLAFVWDVMWPKLPLGMQRITPHEGCQNVLLITKTFSISASGQFMYMIDLAAEVNG